MKSNIVFYILCILLIQIPGSTALPETQYVSTQGNDNSGTGSFEKPFSNIQKAIDAAENGDTVILLQGVYQGVGNFNLNLSGKSITVQSQNPEDIHCIASTIIDAEGQGVIARFINDEPATCVFSGFTLRPGDTSIPVRGAAGFFEFSENARPTTRHLRNGVTNGIDFRGEPIQKCNTSTPDFIKWNGNDPFHQPFPTTDYCGSGDVDLNGEVDQSDAVLTQQIVDGRLPATARADVDGNGKIDENDVNLIYNSRTGAILPGWWNKLSTKSERNDWIDKVVALDQTDQHFYYSNDQDPTWVCQDFAIQTFVNFVYHRSEPFLSHYNGGQTVYNIPMYYVSLSNPSHAINAVLIGGNPLNFDDWRFIEPQTDYDVHPGMWDMLYGCEVRIIMFYYYVTQVTFYVDADGWTLRQYSSNLVLDRSEPEIIEINNHPDFWNPRFLPHLPEKILFERTRADMIRASDIHLADMPLSESSGAVPLIMDSEYSRLYDVYRSPAGQIHLLWKGKPRSANYLPGLYHGILDTVNNTVSDISRISSVPNAVLEGRIIVTPQNEIHVFWLQSVPAYRGIYSTKKTAAGWEPKFEIAPNLTSYGGFPDHYRDFNRYYFDVALASDDEITLMWANPDSYLAYRRYNHGKWRVVQNLSIFDPRGISLITDAANRLHLVYWLGRKQDREASDGRGTLYHSVRTGGTWAPSTVIDNTGKAGCPDLASQNDAVFLVWEKQKDNQVIPVLSKYEDNTWNIPQELEVRNGANAWYPIVECDQNTLSVAWSSRSEYFATIESRKFNIDGTPVPVELISFTAEVTTPHPKNDYKVILKWTTESEKNNYGFEIDKLFISDSSNWEKIGFVKGNGTSTNSNDYAFIDNTFQNPGIYRYRLKQIDFDGNFKYFEGNDIEILAPGYNKLMQNYPNPFNSVTSISFYLKCKGTVSIKLYDVLGKTVNTLEKKEFEPGLHKVIFDAQNLPSGLYFYGLHTNDYSEIKKMLLIR